MCNNCNLLITLKVTQGHGSDAINSIGHMTLLCSIVTA